MPSSAPIPNIVRKLTISMIAKLATMTFVPCGTRSRSIFRNSKYRPCGPEIFAFCGRVMSAAPVTVSFAPPAALMNAG
jgi:hypothetical protein